MVTDIRVERDTRTGIEWVTDTRTGRSYPIPSGGAGEGGKGGDAGTDGGEGDGSEDGDEGDGDEDGDEDKPDPKDNGRAGGEEALRADLAKERKRRKEAEQREKDLRAKTESDGEKREREIREQASAPAQKALRVVAVETIARELGFHDPQDAAALIDLSEIDVDLDADLPSADRDQARKLVETLAKSKPHLVKSTDDEDGDGDDKGKGGGAARGGADHQAGKGGKGGSSKRDPNRQFRELLVGKAGRGR